MLERRLYRSARVCYTTSLEHLVTLYALVDQYASLTALLLRIAEG